MRTENQQIEAINASVEQLPMLLNENMNEETSREITSIRGPNATLQIIFLTLCLAGLQFTWTVEMAYGTPYLLSLGLTKSYMSLVWIAGPLSGWTREITALFTQSEQGDTFKTVSIIIAISSIYVLDFSVNCVQASCRALIVDSLPPSQQGSATAWAGRMVGLGNVAGYFMGYIDLVKYLWFLGNTQLKVLCVLATAVLLLCDLITCYAVREKAIDKITSSTPKKRSPFRLFGDIFKNIWNLPQPIQRISNVSAAAIVIGLCGISWAITMWAPFSLLGEYISAQEALRESKNTALGSSRTTESRVSLSLARGGLESGIYQPVMTTDDEDDEEDIEMIGIKESHRTGEVNGGNGYHERPPAAGVLLGIHNMYIVLPQFLVTFFSSLVFKLLENDEDKKSPTDTIGVILRVGAIMAAIAGFLSMKIGNH
ncbi:hypothetical protein G6F56_001662 [Rhizopus delemar]|nr:hypothetical protein G6F56_001662 [Rhizopus delemar]